MSLALRPRGFAARPQPAQVAAPGSPPSSPPVLDETMLERLAKLVPADVAAVYIPAVALGADRWRWYPLTIAIAGTLLVPLLLKLDARSKQESVPFAQYVVRTLAFVAWAFIVSKPLGASPDVTTIAALTGLLLPLIGERLIR